MFGFEELVKLQETIGLVPWTLIEYRNISIHRTGEEPIWITRIYIEVHHIDRYFSWDKEASFDSDKKSSLCWVEITRDEYYANK